MTTEPAVADLKTTPLYSRHVELGARMVPFAGYLMPVQYKTGILAEHAQTRTAAGLFDVSHMGQAFLVGPDHETTSGALEALMPGEITGLERGQHRYTLLLNEQGGILDDLIVGRPRDRGETGRLSLVVNADCKEADYRHIEMNLPPRVKLVRATTLALLALQGPQAAAVLERFVPGIDELVFMQGADASIDGVPVRISRSGYTGEDGFEISIEAEHAVALWDRFLAQPEVKPIGLGARDSLRLEAGLCLYGHDINQETSPIEAGLGWSIGRRRREEGGFPGSIRILDELDEGPLRVRVGIRPDGRVPAREGAQILDLAGELIGEVTSGGFGPTVGGPVAMGYVVRDFADPGTAIQVVVRDVKIQAEVVKLPFVPHRYRR